MPSKKYEAAIVFKDEGSKTLKKVSGNVEKMNKTIDKGSKRSVKALKKTKQQMKEVAKSAKKMRDNVKKASVALGAIAAAGALAIKSFISKANDQLRAEKQLEAVLESTKNAAGLTADEVKRMAAELQKATTIGDEIILTGQNMLLTFTKIGKEVFPQATETMLDMATAMNNGVAPSAEKLKETSIQLGKALNDPILGATALRRVGVNLTIQQQESIKTMVEMNNILGAQKLILDELSTEFGGSARKQLETFEGQAKQTANTFGDFQEDLGKALIPTLAVLNEKLKSLALWLRNLSPETKEIIAKTILFGGAIAAAGATIGVLILALKPMIALLGALKVGFVALNPVLAGIVLAITAAMLITRHYRKELERLLEPMQKTIEFFSEQKEVFDEAAKSMRGVDNAASEMFKSQSKIAELQAKLVTVQKEYTEEVGSFKSGLLDLIGTESERAKKLDEESKNLKKRLDFEIKADGKRRKSANETTKELVAAQRRHTNLTTEQLQERLKISKEFMLSRIDQEEAFLEFSERASNEELKAFAKKLSEEDKASKQFKNELRKVFSKKIFQEVKVITTDEGTSLGQKLSQLKESLFSTFTTGAEAARKYQAEMIKISTKFDEVKEKIAGVNTELGSGAGGAAKKVDEAEKQKQESMGETILKLAKMKTKINEVKTAYAQTGQSIQNTLDELGESHKETIAEIDDQVKKLQDTLKQLTKGFQEDLSSLDTNVANKIIEKEKEIAKLREEISGKNKEEEQEAIKIINQKIAEQEKELDTLGKIKIGEEELAEARRVAGLTEAERFAEQVQNKRDALLSAFETRKEQLALETQALEDQRTKEQEIFDLKREEYLKTQEAFTAFQERFVEDLDKMQKNAEQKVKIITREIQRLRNAMASLQSATVSKNESGGFSISTKARALGGGAKAGEVLEVGERGKELFVPDTDGNVVSNHDMKNGNISQQRPETRISIVNHIAKEVDSDTFLQKLERILAHQTELQASGSF